MSGAYPDRELPKMKAHRCNDRIEDVMQAVFTGDFSGKVLPAWRSLWACLRSHPGQEPAHPYQVIKDPQRYLNPRFRDPRRNPPEPDA